MRYRHTTRLRASNSFGIKTQRRQIFKQMLLTSRRICNLECGNIFSFNITVWNATAASIAINLQLKLVGSEAKSDTFIL